MNQELQIFFVDADGEQVEDSLVLFCTPRTGEALRFGIGKQKRSYTVVGIEWFFYDRHHEMRQGVNVTVGPTEAE